MAMIESLSSTVSPPAEDEIEEQKERASHFSSIQASHVTSQAREAAENREESKRQFRSLNENLASQLEKTCFQRAQSRQLKDELSGLKRRWGKDTEKLRQLYDTELGQLRAVLDDLESRYKHSEAKANTLENQIVEQSAQEKALNIHVSKMEDDLERANDALAEREKEVAIAKRHGAFVDMERERLRQMCFQLKDLNNSLRTKTETESAKLEAAVSMNVRQREEIDFMKQVHAQEIQELQFALSNTSNGDHAKEFWKQELVETASEMQREFDARLDKAEKSLMVTYEEKMRCAIISQSTSSDMESLRNQNKTLTKVLEGTRERLKEALFKNESLSKESETQSKKMEAERERSKEDKARLQFNLRKAESTVKQLSTDLQRITDEKSNLEAEISGLTKLMLQTANFNEETEDGKDSQLSSALQLQPVSEKRSKHKRHQIDRSQAQSNRFEESPTRDRQT